MSKLKIEPTHLWDEKYLEQKYGFPVRTWQAWRQRGGGPKFVRISSKCVRYRPEDILEWITSRLVNNTSQIN